MREDSRISASRCFGYIAKRTLRGADALRVWGVHEICSARGCISKPHPASVESGHRNAAGLFDTEEMAWRTVPLAYRGSFEMYAFRLLPVAYGSNAQDGLEDRMSAVAPFEAEFESLGHDIVSIPWWPHSPRFQHSPLSCNYKARMIPVNSHCLIDSADRAGTIAGQFAAEQPEPGPYFVTEVLRRRMSAAPRREARLQRG